MGQEFLIDTNILIYYYDDRLPAESVQMVDDIFTKSFNVSIISKIEFLGWQKYDSRQLETAKLFIDNATVYPLTEEIAEETIKLKRVKRIKLPDAVIAATCIVHNLTLVTRNQDDFKGVEELEILNPFEIR